ncbi:caspase family protein [Candidatus Reidiella endopervernicosa]|uniref:caspase family protein n=1 Tax=Candidatus Reidiella endopervernicosa TaxID=2738883 RepID=UPI002A4E1C9C|nr:caspase family protein [Candidatus Reidiella endopervernicosa]
MCLLCLQPRYSTNLHASTRHALLVGVSEYPNLDEKFQLEGPKYDVRLARDFLIESGFDRKQMRVLADGVEGADGLPTSAAIKQALASLANDSQKGDFVYVHFAGHGSQQPITQLISHIMRRMDSMRYSCLET